MISRLLQSLDAALRPAQAGKAGHGDDVLRLAATVLMIEVMRADHHLAPEEESRLVEIIRRHHGLDVRETDELIRLARGEADTSVSLHGFTRQLTDNLHVDERAHIVELLWELVYADGRVDRHEEHLVRQIAEWLYVPHKAFIRAKHRAAKRLGQPD